MSFVGRFILFRVSFIGDFTVPLTNSAGEGTYYLTVVAWNAALSPSTPVCSDGLTVDTTPPLFEGVFIPGGMVEAG